LKFERIPRHVDEPQAPAHQDWQAPASRWHHATRKQQEGSRQLRLVLVSAKKARW
jgi:hypothetical protein